MQPCTSFESVPHITFLSGTDTKLTLFQMPNFLEITNYVDILNNFQDFYYSIDIIIYLNKENYN